jgi:hypothetical protein
MSSEQHIKKILREAETKFNLREGVLTEIYNAEARVVHKGKRRNIRVDLRNILLEALKE